MAVLQVSQIQIRRGLLQDLGQLGAGEFGWAIDQLRLFIGNGTTAEGAPYEGNSEILTTNSDIFTLLGNYRYKGLSSGYEVATNFSRTYQDKIDDFVNVKDFGAMGDGFNDDTTFIQKAIDEIYARRAAFIPITTRRTIYFYPGKYKITDTLKLPPYTSFRNAGKDSVIIELVSSSANCIIRTAESTGKFVGLGLSGVLGPVEISGITFSTGNSNIPIAIIDSAKDVSFYRCKFDGTELNNNPQAINSKGVLVQSSGSTTRSIFFSECDFTRLGTGAEITSFIGTTDVKFDRCVFSNSYQGVKVSSTVNSTVDVKVTNSVFNFISREAIFSGNTVNGVVSAFNTFLNVGKNYSAVASPITPVVRFGGNVNYSIGDIHTRFENQDVAIQAIQHDQGNGLSTDVQGTMKFGNTFQTIGKSIVFPDNTAIDIPVPLNQKTGVFDYSIERGNNNRTGKIKFVLNSLQEKVEFHESYSEINPVGVEINVVYNASLPYIRCAADNSGNALAITYDIKNLQTSI